jgi:hypothetical protein
MQPRGQLWFALEKVCQDFRAFSGLSDREALQILVIVLQNMLNEQKQEFDALPPAADNPAPSSNS